MLCVIPDDCDRILTFERNKLPLLYVPVTRPCNILDKITPTCKMHTNNKQINLLLMPWKMARLNTDVVVERC